MGGGPDPPPLENHKLLYVSLEILVRTPSKTPWVQMLLEGDPYGPLQTTLTTKISDGMYRWLVCPSAALRLQV